MNAKEYLLQIHQYDVKIRQRKQQIAELESVLYGLKGGSLGERVNMSAKSEAAFVASVEKLQALKSELSTLVNNYVDKKNLIVSQIQRLENELYMELLYKKYVEYKRLELIAVEMHYSFIHVRRMHGWALKNFGKKFLKDDTQ